MQEATHINTIPAEAPPPDIGDMKALLHDLEAETGILGHVANSPNTIEAGQLILIEDHLIEIQRKLMALWRGAWERDRQRLRATAAGHTHRGPADLEQVDACWQLLRSAATVALDRCAEAEAMRAVPPSDADAELIALAANYAEANAEIRRLEAHKDEAAPMAYVPLDARRYAAREQAADLTAATLAGLRAKASIYLGEIDLMFGKQDGETRDRDTTDLLADSIARDVLALRAARDETPSATAEGAPILASTPAPEAPPDGWRSDQSTRPDATTLHLAREYMRLDARVKVLNECPDPDAAGMDPVLNRQNAVMDSLIETPSQTPAGWRAKAEAFKAAVEADVMSLDPEHRLALSLAADLMREIKAARP